METQNRSQSKVTSSPFFSLLAEADAIQIREVSDTNAPGIIASIETAVRGSKAEEAQDGDGTYRAFLVQVKCPAPKTEPAPQPPTEPPPPSREHLLDCAALLLKDGDSLLARNIYSFLLKQDIKDAAALKGLGICFHRLGDPVSAKKCFRAVVELYGTADSLLWLALAYLAEKNDAAGLATLRKIENPDTLPSAEERAAYFKEFGNCLLRVGDIASAERCYQNALALGFQKEAILVNLGTLEMQRRNFSKARDHFAASVLANPANARAHCGMGLVAMEEREEKIAIQCFRRALEADAQNIIALTQLVHLSSRFVRETNVREYLQRFLSKDPKNSEVRYSLAAVSFKQGDMRAAERELDTLLTQEPSHVQAQRLKEEFIRNRHQF